MGGHGCREGNGSYQADQTSGKTVLESSQGVLGSSEEVELIITKAKISFAKSFRFGVSTSCIKALCVKMLLEIEIGEYSIVFN